MNNLRAVLSYYRGLSVQEAAAITAADVAAAEAELEEIKRRILAGEPVTDEEAQFLADVEQAEIDLLADC